jgi:cytoskeletal protein CcmA (bactofilin family)
VGKLESAEDLILSGTFEGQLRSARSVQLLTGSRLQGDVQANEIIVQGQVTGNLLARERIRILEGGDVRGDVCAPEVTVQEGVALNARVRMTSHSEVTREYLLPVLLRTESGAAPRQWVAALDACEELLEPCGFVVETRARPSTLMRSIFRSREPLTWQQFRDALERLGDALRPGTVDAAPDAAGLARQGAARAFLDALGEAPEALGILGITVVRHPAGTAAAPETNAASEERFTEAPVAHVEQHPEFLPDAQDGSPPQPAAVLLAMQRVQSEVLGETARTPASGARDS